MKNTSKVENLLTKPSHGALKTSFNDQEVQNYISTLQNSCHLVPKPLSKIKITMAVTAVTTLRL